MIEVKLDLSEAEDYIPPIRVSELWTHKHDKILDITEYRGLSIGDTMVSEHFGTRTIRYFFSSDGEIFIKNVCGAWYGVDYYLEHIDELISPTENP